MGNGGEVMGTKNDRGGRGSKGKQGEARGSKGKQGEGRERKGEGSGCRV